MSCPCNFDVKSLSLWTALIQSRNGDAEFSFSTTRAFLHTGSELTITANDSIPLLLAICALRLEYGCKSTGNQPPDTVGAQALFSSIQCNWPLNFVSHFWGALGTTPVSFDPR
jgi:hypothetical protein